MDNNLLEVAPIVVDELTSALRLISGVPSVTVTDRAVVLAELQSTFRSAIAEAHAFAERAGQSGSMRRWPTNIQQTVAQQLFASLRESNAPTKVTATEYRGRLIIGMALLGLSGAEPLEHRQRQIVEEFVLENEAAIAAKEG